MGKAAICRIIQDGKTLNWETAAESCRPKMLQEPRHRQSPSRTWKWKT